MGTITILPETTINPITIIGERAGVCWGADTKDKEKNYKRGIDCILSGHGRTLEYVNVEMIIDGYSARCVREWYTHIGGAPTRLRRFLLSTILVVIPNGKHIAESSLGIPYSFSNAKQSLLILFINDIYLIFAFSSFSIEGGII